MQVLALVALVAAIALLATGQLDGLSLDGLRAQEENLRASYAAHPLRFMLGFCGVYILVTGLSLPGAVVLTLAGGATLGLGVGTLVVSFASTAGATIAFLISRTLFRDWVQRRFAERLKTIDRGLAREGWLYLLSLRLVPLFPFFVINACMGLTRMSTWRFALISQIGMLPGTLVYVNAGRALAALNAPGDILSRDLIGAFVALAFLPWVARLGLRRRGMQLGRDMGTDSASQAHSGIDSGSGMQADAGARGNSGAQADASANVGTSKPHVFAPTAKPLFHPPAQFDANLIVIGGGAAGLVAAYLAAALKARVVLIEQAQMGGDCLHHGCVPSKALLAAAQSARAASESAEYGVHFEPPRIETAEVMRHVHAVIQSIAPNDSVTRYARLGVECLTGHARLHSPWEVEVNGRLLSARNIVLATGARPRTLTLPGLDPARVLTSDTVWTLEHLPRRLVVVGGGPVGCEMAQAFASLGTEVILLQRNARLLPRDDAEASAWLLERFRTLGIIVHLGTEARAVTQRADGDLLEIARVEPAADQPQTAFVQFDAIFSAIGRAPNTEGLGLEALGIRLRADGTIHTNACLRTHVRSVFACGDVVGRMQFTHAAAHEATHVVMNALLGSPFKRFPVRYEHIPWCTYTDPEVAGVGITEAEALRTQQPFEVTRLPFSELDRAVADQTNGFLKVITPPGSDRILGVTVVGPHAAEILGQFTLALNNNLGLSAILRTVQPYPSYAEAPRKLAGLWRARQTRAWQTRLLARWFAIRRKKRIGIKNGPRN